MSRHRVTTLSCKATTKQVGRVGGARKQGVERWALGRRWAGRVGRAGGLAWHVSAGRASGAREALG